MVMPARTVAQQLVQAFKRHGVEVTFGQSLPSAFQLAATGAGLRQLAYRQENMGGAMADGYARVSGKVAVVTAQNGPAAALLVAPLSEALKASIAIVALVQEVARNTVDKNAFQEFDHARLFDACSKWVRRVDRADRIDDYVDMAFTIAATGRPGPVVLLVPADLLLDEAVDTPRRAAPGVFPLDRTSPDPVAVADAAARLAGAERPLVIAGGGVHVSGATAELARLQEDCHLPVATTVMGKGSVAESHPLSLGVVGYFMGSGARTKDLRALVTEADVILLIGTRTNQNGTDSWSLYPPGASYIHMDIDGTEVGRNYRSARMVCDARPGLAALREALLAAGLEKRAAARPAVEAAVSRGLASFHRLTGAVRGDDRSPVRPERLMADIDRRLTPASIVVADASYSSIWMANYLTARTPGARFIAPRGLAGLGWGLPMALGAKAARPAAPVICIAGDGGFAHSWAELETAVRLRLPVTVIVLNNGVLGYQKDAEDVKFGRHSDACYFSPVDHAAIARACGANGVRIERPEEFGTALDAALASEIPTLLDVITDAEARPPLTFFEGKFISPFAATE
ncbi:acetolactate synthase catalytic subunit [Devosia sp.]|uniref:acetolactate synthase catalytic subunit n=1 Tax=Devosia sp. TaxID=1871048 RepID=UPI002F02167E